MNDLGRYALNALAGAVFAVALGVAAHKHNWALVVLAVAGILFCAANILETMAHQRTHETQRRTIARERARADYAEAEIKKLRRAQHEKNQW